MFKTAPCYSKHDYYEFFNIDFEGKQVLDIGSFRGSFLESSKFDSVKATLSKAKKYVTADINPESGADIIADAHALPIDANLFDIVIANNVIEHLSDPIRGVKEMKLVLKKGGNLYFTIPFLYHLHESPHDYNRFTKFGLQELFYNFIDIEIYARGGFFSTTANLFYKLIHILDYAKLGGLARMLLYPGFWAWVQLDRFDKTEAFTRVYFGKMRK